MPTLLLIDDEKNVLYALEKALRQDGLRIITASTAREGIALVASERPDAVVCDVRLPDQSGLDAFVKMREIDPRLPVVVITAHGTSETAIEAMKRGAFDYLFKPWDLEELLGTVHRALELSRLSRIPTVFDQTEAPADDPQVDAIVGRSPAMQHVYKEIGRVASLDVNVLILGESGTGKELVARAIVQHSQRANQAFMAINCAAIPEALLESELFGHEKGAFTGADRRRVGKFEQAHGGTIFLDEIGDMTPATQAKVLRLLQDGRYERVGGNETIQSNARIIAATNRDLDLAVAKKEFRQDLYYRLNTFIIKLPPLRDRGADLSRLMDYFLSRFSRELGKSAPRITPEALVLLERHSWPGNVRELQSAVKYAIVHATGELITPRSLPTGITGEPTRSAPSVATISTSATDATSTRSLPDLERLIRSLLEDNTPELHDRVHADVDRVLLTLVLEALGGHQVKAAETLGISRTTLRSRLQELGISVERSVRTDG